MSEEGEETEETKEGGGETSEQERRRRIEGEGCSGGEGGGGCCGEDAPGRLDGHKNRSRISHGQRRGACRRATEIVAERGRACGDEAEPVHWLGSMDRSMDAYKGGEARSGKRSFFESSHLSGAVLTASPCGDEVGPSASVANHEEGHSHEEPFSLLHVVALPVVATPGYSYIISPWHNQYHP